eukprot:jgi/Chlat1/9195/Chrsp97S08462
MAADGEGIGIVVVRDGDTLWGLSERLDVEVDALRTANKLEDDLLQPGKVLLVPPATKTVTVEEGDSLSVIAERFGVTAAAVQSANKILDPNTVYAGDVLRIPLPPKTAVLKPVGVQKGSRLSSLVKEVNEDHLRTDWWSRASTSDIDKYREEHRELLKALRYIETSNIYPAPDGDDGFSIGPLQISNDYHTDAWDSADPAGTSYQYQQVHEVEHAERTVIRYWLRYCPMALEFGDYETLARTHNGGPDFWRAVKTNTYWRKVHGTMNPFIKQKRFVDEHDSSRIFFKFDIQRLPFFSRDEEEEETSGRDSKANGKDTKQ